MRTDFTRTVISASAITGNIVRALDVVMCIDSTGSMQPTLDAVKTNALNFKANMDVELTNRGIPPFDQMRVRVIYYKDYGGNYSGGATGTAAGDPDPMRPSTFFSLPADSTPFSDFVSPQVAYGGGDAPESGLECFNEAMRSPFVRVGDTLSNGKRVTHVYPIFAFWTDAGAHLPSFAGSLSNPSYPAPADMPRTFSELRAQWDNPALLDQTNKQIVFFGDPTINDDYDLGNPSGWTEVMTWPRFTVGGSLLAANTNWVSMLAAAISSGYRSPTLTN